MTAWKQAVFAPAVKTPADFRVGAGMALFAALGFMALAASGVIFVVTHGNLSRWPLLGGVTAERILPLVGLGILLSQLRPIALLVSIVALVAGGLSSFVFREVYYTLLAMVPGATIHEFYSGPLSGIVIGLALILPLSRRPVPAVLAAGAAGFLLAISLRLGDTTLHDPAYLRTSLPAAVWLVICIAAAGRLLSPVWFVTASRIAGSWLIAIGLLYGGAFLARPGTAIYPKAPDPAVDERAVYPGFERLLPHLDLPSGGGS